MKIRTSLSSNLKLFLQILKTIYFKLKKRFLKTVQPYASSTLLANLGQFKSLYRGGLACIGRHWLRLEMILAMVGLRRGFLTHQRGPMLREKSAHWLGGVSTRPSIGSLCGGTVKVTGFTGGQRKPITLAHSLEKALQWNF